MALTYLAIVAVIAVASVNARIEPMLKVHVDTVDKQLRKDFSAWATKHQKTYATLAEREARFAVWKDNLAYVQAFNAENVQRSYTIGMNVNADQTLEEYKSTRLGVNFQPKVTDIAGVMKPFRYKDVAPPEAIDWRAKNAVTPVKNQGQCGSCWSFSTTGAIEGINAIKTGKLVSVSEQELIDCDRKKDQGCNGGMMDDAFTFVINNKGLASEAAYPYTATDGICSKTKSKTVVAHITGYEDVPSNSEADLLKAVAMQPVSVAIEADQKSFQLYTGGVYDATDCGTQLDHGVLVVGYGVDSTSNKPFWIIKNSWGPTWGEDGFIRILRNTKAKEGQCGVAMSASYPTLDSENIIA